MAIVIKKDGATLGNVIDYGEMLAPDGSRVSVYWTTAPLKAGEEYEFHFEDGRIIRVRVVMPGPTEGLRLPPGSRGARGSADVLEERRSLPS